MHFFGVALPTRTSLPLTGMQTKAGGCPRTRGANATYPKVQDWDKPQTSMESTGSQTAPRNVPRHGALYTTLTKRGEHQIPSWVDGEGSGTQSWAMLPFWGIWVCCELGQCFVLAQHPFGWMLRAREGVSPWGSPQKVTPKEAPLGAAAAAGDGKGLEKRGKRGRGVETGDREGERG